MLNRFKGREQTIVAGVKLDSSADRIIRDACMLARRTGMSVHLTHAIEPLVLAHASYPDPYLSSSLAYSQEKERLAEARIQLAEMVAAANYDVPISSSLQVGQASDALLAAAQSQNASLLLCSIKSGSYRFVPKGFSTALTLMSEAQTPLLVLPEEHKRDFARDDLRLMIGDDLGPSSENALLTACELTYSLERSSLTHFHIHPQTRAELEDWAVWAADAMLRNQLETPAATVPPDYTDSIETHIRDKMEARVGRFRELLSKGDPKRYEALLLWGKVPEQLQDLVARKNPDMVVFGRHHFLHKKPWARGRIPVYMMLGLHCPVLTVA